MWTLPYCLSGRCNFPEHADISVALQHADSTGAKQRLAKKLEALNACNVTPWAMPALSLADATTKAGVGAS